MDDQEREGKSQKRKCRKMEKWTGPEDSGQEKVDDQPYKSRLVEKVNGQAENNDNFIDPQ